jgi:hypothetical protein
MGRQQQQLDFTLSVWHPSLEFDFAAAAADRFPCQMQLCCFAVVETTAAALSSSSSSSYFLTTLSWHSKFSRERLETEEIDDRGNGEGEKNRTGTACLHK